jgi:hypothetical protein
MRIRMRYGAPLALAAAIAVGVVGVAVAAPNGNSSSLQGSGFNPIKLPKNTYKSGALIVHTHANYAQPGNAPQGGYTDRAQLYFDDDGRLNPTGVPRCDKAKISGNITMKAAMAACGTSKVGTGRAQALTVLPAGARTVNGCVLVFNGKPNAAGQARDLIFTRFQVSVPSSINCANPAGNTAGNVTVLLEGTVKPNPASLGPDFSGGKMLDVPNIPRTLPLSDFLVTTQRGNYISARCHDANKRLNIKGKFTYSDGQSDTVASQKACQVG